MLTILAASLVALFALTVIRFIRNWREYQYIPIEVKDTRDYGRKLRNSGR